MIVQHPGQLVARLPGESWHQTTSAGISLAAAMNWWPKSWQEHQFQDEVTSFSQAEGCSDEWRRKVGVKRKFSLASNFSKSFWNSYVISRDLTTEL